MRVASKTAIVLSGYAAAVAITSAVVAIYIARTSGPDRQTYGAMYAFGDAVLFLIVLGVAAVPATAAALFFLRKQLAFWHALSAFAAVAAITSIVALLTYAIPGLTAIHWLAFAPLRIFAAPPLALLFLLAGIFAPTRAARLVFAGAIASEVMAFVYVTFIWLHPLARASALH